MELREYTDFNQEEILSLYTSVGWENYTRNPQMLERAYENSFLKIAAFEGKAIDRHGQSCWGWCIGHFNSGFTGASGISTKGHRESTNACGFREM